MAPRFPLSAKIFLWFFANLLIIAAAAYAIVEFELHLGPESLLGGRAGRRVDALVDLVNGEIRSEPVDHWTDILTRAGDLYGIHLMIVTPGGRWIAGEQAALPPPVADHLFHPRPGPPGDPLRIAGQPPPELPPGPPGPPPEARPPDGPPPRRDQPGPRPPGPRERRMVHTENPSRYWLLMPIDHPPLPAPGQQPPEYPPFAGPLDLVAFSDSFGLGGLVLDFTPWFATAAGILIFSCLFWLPLVRGITRSIREMTAATARIAEGGFDVRVRDTRGDELGLLAGSINGMAQRLAGFVSGQKRFLGDIAHELCSPLARAQVALGILEARVGAGPLADLSEEVQQISALVNELLSFSKASLAAGRIQLRPTGLEETLVLALHRESLPGSMLQSTIPPGLTALADPDLLCRALCNLLRNFAKYAASAGPMEAAAHRAGSEVVLTLSDRGPGVPEEALPQLFDPFFRIDTSRARETGGAGLGLAIVKTCIESCGGRVTCQNRQPHGLTVTITLRGE